MDPTVSSSIEAIPEWLVVLRPIITAAYGVTLGVLCLFGLHRFWLLWSYWRSLKNAPEPSGVFDEAPRVTIQLPMFNEPLVAHRVIEAVSRIDYPRDRLDIQVLDDSTDQTSQIAERCCRELAEAGHDIHYIHRNNRSGYKAGALKAGLASAKGEFVAVFDADFMPPVSFLRETMDHFTDDRVGMVQACWDHLNRGDSLLTRGQAIFLDGHFLIEHTARNRSGRWMNFNGTAGVWRRSTIEDAGGWQHDTITEDVDLSYRAQLAGWRFVYLPGLKCAAELPPRVADFKSQQHRWAKGTIEVARKILPRIARADITLATKIEAGFHLCGPLVYPCVVLLAVLALPVLWLNVKLVD
ncbi:MAG: glycosyltransferase, partial [Planctomycetota bacterium]